MAKSNPCQFSYRRPSQSVSTAARHSIVRGQELRVPVSLPMAEVWAEMQAGRADCHTSWIHHRVQDQPQTHRSTAEK